MPGYMSGVFVRFAHQLRRGRLSAVAPIGRPVAVAHASRNIRGDRGHGRFHLRGGTENGSGIVEAFSIGLGRKIQVAAVCLRFARKCPAFRFSSVLLPFSCMIFSSVDKIRAPLQRTAGRSFKLVCRNSIIEIGIGYDPDGCGLWPAGGATRKSI